MAETRAARNQDYGCGVALTPPRPSVYSEQKLKAQKTDNPPKQKKPYVKPAFQCEKVFETLALACGKIYGTQPQCRFSGKSS